jgi:tRNA-dihydrouridine synthase
MPNGFWSSLATPIIGLSPMDGVTDHPCRFIQKKYGQPAIIYTEFTSVEGVCHGAERLLKDFHYDESQRPIIGQIYGTTPEYFRQTALILCQLGFDGVDINMGCPAKNVAHSGAGAALIKTPDLAQEIVRAAKQGVLDWQNGKTVADCPDITQPIRTQIEALHAQLPPEYQAHDRVIPVSIKTRVGFDVKSVAEWIPRLLEVEPAAIAIHGRMLKQYYTGEADWDEIGKAATIAQGSGTRILGNGDIKNHVEAEQKATTYNLDGVLIGRGSMGDPAVFGHQAEWPAGTTNFSIALEHAQVYEDTYKDDPNYHFLPMRKHLGWYVHRIPNASAIRVEMFKANSAAEVEAVLIKYGLL